MANAVITVLEADGSTETDVTVLDVGRQAAAASKSVATCTEDKAVLDAIAASLSVLDDFDESDRAKVNLIVGQAGIAAGSGNVGATVPRMTLAADDPLVTLVTGVAHDAADSGNASKIGAKATTSLSAKTMVSNNDRTDLFSGVDGVLITRAHCNLEDIVWGVASNTDGTSTEVIASAGAGLKQYLTSVSIVNMHVSTTAYVELKSGTTVKWRLPVPPGGVVQTFNVPLPPNAADEAWNFDSSAAVTTLYFNAVGFKSKV